MSDCGRPAESRQNRPCPNAAGARKRRVNMEQTRNYEKDEFYFWCWPRSSCCRPWHDSAATAARKIERAVEVTPLESTRFDEEAELVLRQPLDWRPPKGLFSRTHRRLARWLRQADDPPSPKVTARNTPTVRITVKSCRSCSTPTSSSSSTAISSGSTPDPARLALPHGRSFGLRPARRAAAAGRDLPGQVDRHGNQQGRHDDDALRDLLPRRRRRLRPLCGPGQPLARGRTAREVPAPRGNGRRTPPSSVSRRRCCAAATG